ncbi:TerC family protein [Nitratireductor aquimarinus]|uniref:TerC family protein n=1 Tax=Alphaproteobacteria TaxID=28211 RepID=UPI0019D37CAF|nr:MULTISPECIES: TerC family protein [Alphaproteobacteria]MBY6023744.1 TerC family protein [Nitratireductor sp. DP7N14-4]MBN7758694.1 TerC family protein [Nitratireductor aquimarinus]MBN7759513.1 TerC family protein [Nitratireductor aquibiodomus]MBN8244456.1 TerC family protein [Nitratireductor aquimarinus]MBY6001456.1 TerC family protein [Tritonibacter mobilis]
MTTHDWLWPGFLAFVAVILFFDLFVLHRRDHVITTREAMKTVAGYVALAMVFAAGVFYFGGKDRGAEFLTGYLVEQALSLDNIFVIALIFTYFKVPSEAQYRVLFYGILGAIVMRLSLIVPGVKLVDQFMVIGMALGALLVFSGFKMMTSDDEMVDPGESRIVKLLMRTGRVTEEYEGSRFLTRRNGLLYMTPLFVVLVTVEFTDLIFAVDSIPAVLAISNDPFIVFSSNVFAVMGLRAMFFVLSGMMRNFKYLQTGLSLVLMFIGFKMLIAHWIKIPSPVALSVTALLIGGSVVISILARKREEQRARS